MVDYPAGSIAVIFVSRRTSGDDAGYAAAADAMGTLAARQPGYLGIDSVRGADGVGITVSYWADDASARAWHAHPDHAAVRAKGHADWYDGWHIVVGEVVRAYAGAYAGGHRV